ncbi:hypothetical protein LX36DRAFT_443206 [Colletotrichum falcatum]|nr:hypothetical protein LX36DRAFT_443206 [Colletotrichum falcatum]
MRERSSHLEGEGGTKARFLVRVTSQWQAIHMSTHHPVEDCSLLEIAGCNPPAVPKHASPASKRLLPRRRNTRRLVRERLLYVGGLRTEAKAFHETRLSPLPRRTLQLFFFFFSSFFSFSPPFPASVGVPGFAVHVREGGGPDKDRDRRRGSGLDG